MSNEIYEAVLERIEFANFEADEMNRKLDEMGLTHVRAIVPEWTYNNPDNVALDHITPVLILELNDQVRNQVHNFVIRNFGDRKAKLSAPLKSYGEGLAPFTHLLDYPQNFGHKVEHFVEISRRENIEIIRNNQTGAAILHGPAGILTIRGSDWWSEQDRNNFDPSVNEVPNYAIDVLPIRGFEHDRQDKLIDPKEINSICSYGREEEYQIVMEFNGQYAGVDIQGLIKMLSDYGLLFDIEGWASQGETALYPIFPGDGASKTELINAQNLLIIHEVIDLLGLQVMPCGVMVGNRKGQPNMGTPHVQYVLMRGMKSAAGRDLTLNEASNMLGGFGTNGWHLNFGHKRGPDGLVSDRRQTIVANLTHPEIIPMLRAVTHSGNTRSLEALEDSLGDGFLSTREINRTELATARVGNFLPFSSDETVRSFIDDQSAQALERASHDEGKTPHNPLGRRKGLGINEFTFLDGDFSHYKGDQLSVLLAAYTAVVDKCTVEYLHRDFNATTEDVREYIFQQSEGAIERGYFDVFVGLLNNQDRFIKLIQNIDRAGLESIIEINGKEVGIDQILMKFTDWVTSMTERKGIILSEDQSSLLENFRDQLDLAKWANTFEEYAETGIGPISCIAQREFIQELSKFPNPPSDEERQMVFNRIIHKINLARLKHLRKVYAERQAALE